MEQQFHNQRRLKLFLVIFLLILYFREMSCFENHQVKIVLEFQKCTLCLCQEPWGID